MTQQYDNNFTGCLFKNNKDGNEKRPDYRGSAEVNGVKYWVSAWIQTPKAGGDKFMSMKYEAQVKADEKPAAPGVGPGTADPHGFADDVPF